MELTGTPGIPIAHFRKLWHPQNNVGRIDIQLANGQSLTIQLDNAQEFLTVSATLSEPYAVLLPDGTLMGWR